MIEAYIEKYHSFYSQLQEVDRFEENLKKDVFIEEEIRYYLAGFDDSVFEIINLLQLINSRLEETTNDLTQGKLNKNDIRFYSAKIRDFMELRRGLRVAFDSMTNLLGKKNIDVYSEYNLNKIFGEIKNYMNIAGEISHVLSEIKKHFARSDDSNYFYFDITRRDESDNTGGERESTNIIQISPILAYDKVNYTFGAKGKTEQYRINSEERIIFMKILIGNSTNGDYVNYNKFAEALGLSRYDTGVILYEQRIPSRTKEKIREIYKALRRSLETGLHISEDESNFCGGARGGFRLEYLIER